MVEELVSKVFAARNATHIRHWATKSYAEHVALNGFYDGAIDLIDKFVEAYQGCYGLIDMKELSNDIEKDVIKLLNAQYQWIGENEEEIAGEVSALENILQELSGLYLTTIYKLENLS